MTEPVTEKEAREALDKVNTALTTTTAKFEAAGVDDLCKKYKEIRPWLQKALGLIRLIPGIGPQVATAIEFLMKIADAACPVALAA